MNSEGAMMGAIRVEGLGKFYKRYPNRWARLAEWLSPDDIERHEKHWVLRDIDFEVRAGESVGIVGHNGAGKSTLLKIITGTTRPSAGTVQVIGRVAALLELGMGFHPDFTGRQNAYMAGQLLGYSGEDIARNLPQIIAFADIGDYLDQAVRTYSSGMQMRLAFSVATAIRPDILIVDEALSVGDIFFQQKCFERIRQFREAGTTLLFVTHAPSTIYALCDRAILLDHGILLRDGTPKAVIDLYQRKELELLNLQHANASAPTAVASVAPPRAESVVDEGAAEGEASADGDFATGFADIDAVSIYCDGMPATMVISDSQVTVEIAATAHVLLDDPHIGFQIRNARGEPVFMTNTYCMKTFVGPLAAAQRVVVRFSMKLSLAAGEYTVTAGGANGGHGLGSFHQALGRKHAAAKLSIAADPAGIVWAGTANLHPSVEVVRTDSH
jgi:lipopolysaccharide transport system ATP-binding protein